MIKRLIILMLLLSSMEGLLAENQPAQSNIVGRTMPSTLEFIQFALPSTAEKKQKQKRQQRHKKCLQALEKYFMEDVPHAAMKKFLLAQYEITSAKALSLTLLLRSQEQRRYGHQGMLLPAKDYTTLVRNKMAKLRSSLQNDPEFVKAYESFSKAPLTVETFARIAPYLQKLAHHDSSFDENVVQALRFDENDMKMLDVLVTMEQDPATKKNINLVSFLQWADMKQMGALQNYQATIEESINNLIKPNEEYIKNFLDALQTPKECRHERHDILVGEMQCQDCYIYSRDSIYTLVASSKEIAQILFNAALKRKDLQQVRKDKFSWKLFYFGTNSPWGDVAEGMLTTPKARLDPEQ